MNPALRPAPEPTREALIDALAQRDRELADERRRAAAMAEVLEAINSSSGELAAVFDAIVEKAMRFCDAACGGLWAVDGELVRPVNTRDLPEPYREFLSRAPVSLAQIFGRAARDRPFLHIEDLAATEAYRDRLPITVASVELARVRTFLGVPLREGDRLVGIVNLMRQELRPFSDEQIAIVRGFAVQAEIAMKNARLFNETREALERQTATAEILKVIASSPSDVQPVFEAIATSANRLIGGVVSSVWRFADDTARLAAHTPIDRAAEEALTAMSPRPLRDFPAFALVRDGRASVVVDTEVDDIFNRELARLVGFRSILRVPLMSLGEPIGLITATRKEPGAFAAHQVQLLQTFADQAVIAIQNARLFSETQEALRQQTATADVLKAISRSAFDLQTVLETLIHSAKELCGANRGAIFLRDGDLFRWQAATDSSEEYVAYIRAHPQSAGRGSTVGRVILSGKVECVADVLEDSEFVLPANALVQARATLGAPLLRDGEVEGVLVLTRSSSGLFTQRQIELVETFADQAVIAIENVRLFDEVQARTRDLTEALQQQTATADVLKVISRSAFDLQAVFDTLVESAARLCEADSALITNRESDGYRVAATYSFLPEFDAFMRDRVLPTERGSLFGRVALERQVVHIPDCASDPEYTLTESITLGKANTLLGVPLLRDGVVVGTINLAREQVRPFTERQIELVRTFADQAVIAIENVRLFDEVQARTRDLTEALQQQTATAEVLKIISRSAFDLQTVLDTLVASAARLSGAEKGCIMLRQGELYFWVSNFGFSEEHENYVRSHPFAAGGASATSRAARDKRAIHIPDVLADREYTASENQRLGNYRTILAMPLMREGAPIGVFIMTRERVRPFNDREIDLLQTFADQAVIAIENVRLFDEVQARTRDLSEALRQQTATADVLKVISRSAFDLQVVLDTLVSSASRLCEAEKACIFQRMDDDLYHWASNFGFSEELVTYAKANPFAAGTHSTTSRVALERRVIHARDVLADPEYAAGEYQRLGNYRTNLGVPLLREGEPIGVFVMTREAVRPFNERQIELLTTFADQAVIAIENSRLFDEVQARTRDLSEALQLQTATSDVLKVISRSAFDLQAVFDTLIASAVELCGAFSGTICVREGDVFRYRGSAGDTDSAALAQYLAEHPATPGRGSMAGRVLLSGKVEAIPDRLEDAEFVVPMDAHGHAGRALLGVPLLGKDGIAGALVLTRKQPGRFTERQIEIVQTFADQAVIAIENVRLFDEVQARTRDLSEALQQQTATADVLKAISRSAFDLQTVLDTLVRSAVALCDGDGGLIYQKSGDAFYGRAFADHSEEFIRFFKTTPQRPGRATVGGRVLLTGEVQNIADLRADPDYDPRVAAINKQDALLGVPLLRDKTIVGAIVLGRRRPEAFTQRQIELVQTFADQAVIAIENVRLFDEVQARTRELAASLDDLRKAQDRLVQTEKLASLGQLTAGIAHEIKNPLNFVNNFSALSRELLDELRDVLANASLKQAERVETDELIEMVASNLDKVVSHGKRADSIVKNMLLHSREGSGERSSVDVNAMVEEALNLAYHGARAEKPGFNVTIVKSLDPRAGAVDLHAQEMTRVLLNVISNGFYATAKRRQGETNEAYEPMIAASTRDLGHSVEIAIRDNGIGITEEVKARMFNPFFTTKPAGEGTGLGLSLSHDIVVKQHGGALEVATEPGSFTEFTIRLPRAGDPRAKQEDRS